LYLQVDAGCCFDGIDSVGFALFVAGMAAATIVRALMPRLMLLKLRRDVGRVNAGDYRFLQNFVAAGIQGEVRELFIAGPPWRLSLLVRFDDWADASDGTRI